MTRPKPRVAAAIVLWSITACTRASPPADETIADDAPELHGVVLPRAATRAPVPAHALEVFVQPDGVLVDGVRLAGIDAAGIAGARHHRSEPLDDRLRGGDVAVPVVVFADRSVPFGSVIDVMYSASQAGRESLAFAVAGDPMPGAIAFAGPRTWDPATDDIHIDAACGTRVVLDGLRARITPCVGPETFIDVMDAATLASMGALLVATRYERYLHLQAPAVTPWATVVGVIDGLAAAPCPGPPDAEPSHECRPWGVLVDLDPPLPWHPGDWDALKLSIYDIDPEPSAARRRRYTEPKLRARAQRAIPALERCLRSSADLRLRMPRCIELLLAYDDDDREVAVMFPMRAPLCAAEVFAPLATQVTRLLPGDASVRFAVDFPLPAGIADDPGNPPCRPRRHWRD